MADQVRKVATRALDAFITLHGRERFRLDRAVDVVVEAYVAERCKDPEVHTDWCQYVAHQECCRGLFTCDCLIAERILNVEGTSE